MKRGRRTRRPNINGGTVKILHPRVEKAIQTVDSSDELIGDILKPFKLQMGPDIGMFIHLQHKPHIGHNHILADETKTLTTYKHFADESGVIFTTIAPFQNGRIDPDFSFLPGEVVVYNDGKNNKYGLDTIIKDVLNASKGVPPFKEMFIVNKDGTTLHVTDKNTPFSFYKKTDENVVYAIMDYPRELVTIVPNMGYAPV